MKKNENRPSSLFDVLVALKTKGSVPGVLQARIFARYELGEVSGSPDDGFALHEIMDVVTYERRKIDVLVKTYFVDGSYAGNAIAVRSSLRVSSIVRAMLDLRESGQISFDSIDVYCDSEQSDGALIFGRRLVVKFSRGRARRANNYYVDILESDKSEVAGRVTDWSAVAMVETVLKRWGAVDLTSEHVPMAMRRLNRQLRKPYTR